MLSWTETTIAETKHPTELHYSTKLRSCCKPITSDQGILKWWGQNKNHQIRTRLFETTRRRVRKIQAVLKENRPLLLQRKNDEISAKGWRIWKELLVLLNCCLSYSILIPSSNPGVTLSEQAATARFPTAEGRFLPHVGAIDCRIGWRNSCRMPILFPVNVSSAPIEYIKCLDISFFSFEFRALSIWRKSHFSKSLPAAKYAVLMYCPNWNSLH